MGNEYIDLSALAQMKGDKKNFTLNLIIEPFYEPETLLLTYLTKRLGEI